MQNNYRNGGAYPNGMRQPKFTNVFTDEQINERRSRHSATGSGITITPAEIEGGQCTHRTSRGERLFNPIPTPPGKVGDGWKKCSYCGAVWQDCQDISIQSVQKCCDDVVSILQTLKVMNPDIPEEFCKEFMKIIPMVSKVPIVWDNTVKVVNQYYNGGYNRGGYNGNRFSASNTLNHCMGGVFGGGFNGGMQQGGWNQQPMQQGGWNQQQPQQQAYPDYPVNLGYQNQQPQQQYGGWSSQPQVSPDAFKINMPADAQPTAQQQPPVSLGGSGITK